MIDPGYVLKEQTNTGKDRDTYTTTWQWHGSGWQRLAGQN